MKRTISPWFERKFPTVEKEAFTVLLERLEGTPIRVEKKLSDTPETILKAKPEGQWSILEQVGHLADLEPLWLGRVGDITNGLEVMRSADLSNQKTHQARHNERSVEEVLTDFITQRKLLTEALLALAPEDLDRSSLHPRLKTLMSITDLMHFVAEHDDHHLAICSILMEK